MLTWWLSTFSWSFKHFIWFNFEDWRIYFTVRVFYYFTFTFVSKSISFWGTNWNSFNSYIYCDFLGLFATVFTTSFTPLFLGSYLYFLGYYLFLWETTATGDIISLFTIYSYLGWWLCVLVFKMSQLNSAYSFATTLN